MPLVTRNWRWKEEISQRSCAKGSIRTIVRAKKRGVNTLLVRVCCPKGNFTAKGRCIGGMKTQGIGKRKAKT
jgi:hypothetical protein